MNTIRLSKHHEIRKDGKWVLGKPEHSEEREIGYEEFHRITSYQTRKFFESLGGKERVYYKQGEIIKLVSTSPDQTERYIYNFRHE